MLKYEEFYNRIWNVYISESDVSLDYREQNADFIRIITFSFWKKYTSKNVSDSVYGEVVKIFFTNMFLYNPDNFDTGEVRDFNSH